MHRTQLYPPPTGAGNSTKEFPNYEQGSKGPTPKRGPLRQSYLYNKKPSSAHTLINRRLRWLWAPLFILLALSTSYYHTNKPLSEPLPARQRRSEYKSGDLSCPRTTRSITHYKPDLIKESPEDTLGLETPCLFRKPTDYHRAYATQRVALCSLMPPPHWHVLPPRAIAVIPSSPSPP